MRIVRATDTFSAELKEFMCAAVQRRRDDDGFRGSRGGGKSRNAMDLDSDSGNRLVCVTGGVSYLGRAIVKRLLVHGYSVRIVVDCPEDKEKVSEMEADAETASFSNRITSVVSRLTEIESLIKAFDGCAGVFHTSAFVDPAGVSGYSKSMAELEAKVSENVIQACTRTASVRKCVFTSSLLACTWQNNTYNNLDYSVINEESWSDEQLCIDKKLWYALGKLKAEKAAWRIADSKGLKLATICPALITGPDFFNRNSTSTLAYLKGAKEMYSNGLLATMDVNKLAKAHVCLWEGLGNKTAFGRYICFDTILSRDGAEKLAKDIGVQIEKICGNSNDSDANAETDASLQISDKKLLDLMSRTLRSCYHES
ncbi:NAD-dependent epimerase/dehydratase [Arabidopsis thaliana x Arabidopsis arenosa]|uniref:NAD-dependent epimerase/dehydratase n=1 Tax=Arabidopsis thaliana x Arabidopsis arenosa TaxID=1240361 RepID=A0A8T1YX08_9BRAS|nr:NAD-dependent epimerase/dehydratase [Arabidopsis thaliana x Arabidopsis arenosa]